MRSSTMLLGGGAALVALVLVAGSVGDAAELSPIRDEAVNLLHVVVPSAYPEERFAALAPGWDPETAPPGVTTCGALPFWLYHQLGDPKGIAGGGTVGVVTAAKAHGAWRVPGRGGALPLPGDVLVFSSREDRADVVHVDVFVQSLAAGTVILTADAGQGTREIQRAAYVQRNFDAESGATSSPSGHTYYLVGWLDLEVYFASLGGAQHDAAGLVDLEESAYRRRRFYEVAARDAGASSGGLALPAAETLFRARWQLRFGRAPTPEELDALLCVSRFDGGLGSWPEDSAMHNSLNLCARQCPNTGDDCSPEAQRGNACAPLSTWELVNGERVEMVECFRVYDSWEAATDDYLAQMTAPLRPETGAALATGSLSLLAEKMHQEHFFTADPGEYAAALAAQAHEIGARLGRPVAVSLDGPADVATGGGALLALLGLGVAGGAVYVLTRS